MREVKAHEAHASIDHAQQRGQLLRRRPDGGHDLGEGQPQPTHSRHLTRPSAGGPPAVAWLNFKRMVTGRRSGASKYAV
eukprot:scaffold131735_cov24-Phaeocystis_antarctica.AAC.1